MADTIYVGLTDIANMIGISPSTVKKYYLAIEERGYRFRRNLQGQMMFNEDDLEMFRKLITIKNQPGMTVQKAVEKVTADITDMTPYEQPESADMTVITEQIAELKEMFLTIQKDLAEIKQEQQSAKKVI